MPDRIAVNRIIAGHGEDRTVIEPGERFNTNVLHLPAGELKRLDDNGVVRAPRERDIRRPEDTGPRVEAEAEAEPAGAAEAQPEEPVEEKPAAGRRGRGRTDLDEL